MIKKLILLILLLFTISSCTSSNNNDNAYQHDDKFHWTSSTDKVAHSFDYEVTKLPTCTSFGTGKYKCSVCGYSYEVELPKYDHEGSETWLIDESNNTHYHYCDQCENKYDISTHSYATYKYNETQHWGVCACGKEDTKVNHSFSISITKMPTNSGTAGTIEYKCECGYSYEVPFEPNRDKANSLIDKIDDLTGDEDVSYLAELINEYNGLPSFYQNLVTNYQTLDTMYNNSQGDIQSKVDEIINKINNIKGIETLTSTIVNEIDTAYNNLTSYGKSLVTNYSIFTGAKAAYESYSKTDFTSLNALQKALYNVAYNYYYQGTQIQYDQNNAKRNVLAYFNDATADQFIYLDCSSFVNTIYNMCFDQNIISSFVYYNTVKSTNYSVDVSNASSITTENIIKYASNGPSNDNDIIYYVKTADWSSKTDTQKIDYIKNTIIANLQVGDLICYRHYTGSATQTALAYGTAGHIMMYLGNGKFIHCTGTSNSVTEGTSDPSTFTTEKQTTTEKNNGAIVINDVSYWYTTSNSRYLFADDVTSFTVLRPLNKMKNLTSVGQSMVNNQCINVEKTSNVTNHASVQANSNVTYKLTIKNSSSAKVNYLYIDEIIPVGTTYVSSTNGGVYKDGHITWQVANLSASNSITLEYTLKMPSTVGATILDSQTYVNGVRTNMMLNQVAGSFDESKFNNLVSTKNGSNATSLIDVAKDIYQSMGINCLNDIGTDKYLCTNTLAYYVKNSDAVLYNVVASILYGGTGVRNNAPDNNNQMKYMSPDYLEKGDIIATHTTYNEDTYSAYLYVSSTEIYGIKNGTFTLVYSGATAVKEFVHTLPYYKRFVIIRPKLFNASLGD